MEAHVRQFFWRERFVRKVFLGIEGHRAFFMKETAGKVVGVVPLQYEDAARSIGLASESRPAAA